MKQALIIGSAPDTDLTVAKSLINDDTIVICADGGIDCAREFCVKVDFFVGDLDSSRELTETLEAEILPREKDFTDMECAVNRAIELGAETLYLLGCTNGRADHYLANIALLELIHEKGVRGVIIDKQNRIFYNPKGKTKIVKSNANAIFDNGGIIIPADYTYISVLAVDKILKGVSFSGVKYQLKNAKVSRLSTLCVSNELVSDCAELFVKKGDSLIIISKDVQ